MRTEEQFKILETKKYKDARKKINNWKASLKDADEEKTKKIHDEIDTYFSRMRHSDHDFYLIFETDAKELSEIIHEKLTGQKIIID